MEISYVKVQETLPDSTTAIVCGKQDLTTPINPLQVTGEMDATLTDLLLGGDSFALNSSVEDFLSFHKSVPSPGKQIFK